MQTNFEIDSEIVLNGPNVHGVITKQSVTVGSEEFKNMVVRCRTLGMSCIATADDIIVCQVDKGYLIHPLLDVKMTPEPYTGQISLGALVNCMQFKMAAENKEIMFAPDHNVPISVAIVATDEGLQTLTNYKIIEQTDKDIHIEYDRFDNNGNIDGRIQNWFRDVF